MFPSEETAEIYVDKTPLYFVIGLCCSLVIISITLIQYMKFTSRRYKKVAEETKKFETVLTALFPPQYRDMLLDEKKAQKAHAELLKKRKKDSSFVEDDGGNIANSKPVAEMYPDARVCFADLAGFTAWSASCEPSHVFILLKTMYNALDKIAKKY